MVSCHCGHIYIARQLFQLFNEPHGEHKLMEPVWQKDGRSLDALRPSVEPVEHDPIEAVLALRSRHLAGVRAMLASLDLFIFTMGLTEGWESTEDGTMIAPGTVTDTYDPARHAIGNLRAAEIAYMLAFREGLHCINPVARMMLTVSPVPLASTTILDHVLVATIYANSVLSAVAGELIADFDDIQRFLSYDTMTSHPSRGMFFEPDIKNVGIFGVN